MKTRPKTWLLLLPAVILLTMAAAAAYLAWRGFTLLNRDGLATSETAAAIQGLAAALSLAVTVCLVGVTGWYAYLVNKQIRLSVPNVSLDWYIAWVDPSEAATWALRASITDLHEGPTTETHTEWLFAVDLTNTGNHAVSIRQVLLFLDRTYMCQYSGSSQSLKCPFELAGHSTSTLFFEPTDVHDFLENCKHVPTSGNRDLQVHVHLGSGIMLSSKKVPLRHFIV
ncbi:MAG: hypothetical protein OXG40_07185 [Acidimicrobiaceae bacterium]|nr:hypothetical protein [Acidimicrobiaceae bacterium]MDE0517738.1 hypothetical protein [Acidimicrobiaceae bacterium]